MPFLNESAARSASASNLKAGRANVDSGELAEDGLTIPVPSGPSASWAYFDCAVGCMLDSGIVIHNRLPQVDNTPDTLASSLVGLDDPVFDKITGKGVNLRCQDQYTDIVQRMGHARYWFRIWGQALRFYHRIPIPGIKTIGGVPAIPYDRNPQWAFCRIAPGGNFAGVILWHAAWSLWYTTAVPPRSNAIPEADPAARISGDTRQPKAIQVPFTIPDQDSVRASPIEAINDRPSPTNNRRRRLRGK